MKKLTKILLKSIENKKLYSEGKITKKQYKRRMKYSIKRQEELLKEWEPDIIEQAIIMANLYVEYVKLLRRYSKPIKFLKGCHNTGKKSIIINGNKPITGLKKEDFINLPPETIDIKEINPGNYKIIN